MSFLDDVKRFGKNLTDKGKDMVEVAKLNSQINSEKENIKELYRTIGGQGYQDDKNSGEGPYAELCGQIAEIEAKIKELSDKVLELKNASKCPNCGTEVSKDSAFCPKCGTKLGE